MSEYKTPCQQLGYKEGDKFKVIVGNVNYWKGEIVTLNLDDGSNCPKFTDGATTKFMHIDFVEKLPEEPEQEECKVLKVGDDVLIRCKIESIICENKASQLCVAIKQGDVEDFYWVDEDALVGEGGEKLKYMIDNCEKLQLIADLERAEARVEELKNLINELNKEEDK